jgi:hypothetical protein
MHFLTGYKDVPTAGTQVQVNNVSDRVLWIRFSAETGTVYIGISSVSASAGFKLITSASQKVSVDLEFDFGRYGGSVPFSDFWVDAATNGDNLVWAAILSD